MNENPQNNERLDSLPKVAGHDPGELLTAAVEAAKSSTARHTPPGQWEPPLPADLSGMLPGYEVTGVLGRGGMGAVYKGIQTSLDRQVEIKLLPPELGVDAEFEARFKREAKSMAKLNHPNIVQIYDFGQTEGGHHFIVMEFVDGTDLHRMIRAGQLEPEGALNAISQICDALEYAHTEGFVHRDIKPANIFINS
jgi:serine/threonine protein kinase